MRDVQRTDESGRRERTGFNTHWQGTRLRFPAEVAMTLVRIERPLIDASIVQMPDCGAEPPPTARAFAEVASRSEQCLCTSGRTLKCFVRRDTSQALLGKQRSDRCNSSKEQGLLDFSICHQRVAERVLFSFTTQSPAKDGPRITSTTSSDYLQESRQTSSAAGLRDPTARDRFTLSA